MSISISDSRGYKIFIFVASGFITGFAIANIIYFNRLRSPSTAPLVSPGEATALMWLNIILLILSAIAFIWSLISLVTTHRIIIPAGVLPSALTTTTSVVPSKEVKVVPTSAPPVTIQLQ